MLEEGIQLRNKSGRTGLDNGIQNKTKFICQNIWRLHCCQSITNSYTKFYYDKIEVLRDFDWFAKLQTFKSELSGDIWARQKSSKSSDLEVQKI